MGYNLWLCRPRGGVLPSFPTAESSAPPPLDELEDLGTGDEVRARLEDFFPDNKAAMMWWLGLGYQFCSFWIDRSEIRFEFRPGSTVNRRIHFKIGFAVTDRSDFIQRLCNATGWTAVGNTAFPTPRRRVVVRPDGSTGDAASP